MRIKALLSFSGGGTGLFVAWLGVVMVGLFVPLMDNDSAHHANIALRMFLTGDYVSLVDYDGPYLDKPHLHFWLSALSYHLFGVTGFAYKFPSFVFSLMGIWAVFRAGCLLFNESVGRVASIVFATSASFLLALNDVRMDAILTAAVAISVWQFLGYYKKGRTDYMIGLALGMAIGFCTKGHIGVLVPALFAFFFSLINKNWKPLFNWRVLIGAACFFILIGPVVYCYYVQFNLHPELVVRGKNQIDGVRFILWDQSVGRYSGEMGVDAQGDKLFFFHSFLWVFAPWSLVSVFALFAAGWRKRSSSVSAAALAVLLVFGFLVGFSSFKLPHYLNVILPLAALWIAAESAERPLLFTRATRWAEWMLWMIIGVVAGLVLVWWFPQQHLLFWVGWVLCLSYLFYTLKRCPRTGSENQVLRMGVGVIVLFWILNAAFYKSLLTYQGGNVLAKGVGAELNGASVYSLKGCYSSSFNFYTCSLRQEVSVDEARGVTGYILLDKSQLDSLRASKIEWTKEWSVLDYEITRLSLGFLDPEKRESYCSRLMLVKLK